MNHGLDCFNDQACGPGRNRCRQRLNGHLVVWPRMVTVLVAFNQLAVVRSAGLLPAETGGVRRPRQDKRVGGGRGEGQGRQVTVAATVKLAHEVVIGERIEGDRIVRARRCAAERVQLLKTYRGRNRGGVTVAPLPTTPAPVTLPPSTGAAVAVMVRVVATKFRGERSVIGDGNDRARTGAHNGGTLFPTGERNQSPGWR